LIIFRRPWKFLNNCGIVHYGTIDYMEDSRINIKIVIEQNNVCNVHATITLSSKQIVLIKLPIVFRQVFWKHVLHHYIQKVFKIGMK